jgi:DNA-directed RNA polymerase subunit RPC12/RpoP
MLLCKSCNTRFEDGKTACPSCGRRIFVSLKEAPRVSDPEPTPLSTAPVNPLEEVTVPAHELSSREGDLGEVDVLAEAALPEAAEELKREAPVKPRAVEELRREAAVKPRARVRKLEPEPGPAVFHLTAAQVRTLVVEQPALLEPDLSIYRDAKSNAVGVDLRTPVGSIDLLARDRDGTFVVVSVPDPRDVESLMPEMLARIGYVRKHYAIDKRPVRGIVVIEEIPEELAYAAAGVAQTISFRAYRVALSFHPLPI